MKARKLTTLERRVILANITDRARRLALANIEIGKEWDKARDDLLDRVLLRLLHDYRLIGFHPIMHRGF